MLRRAPGYTSTRLSPMSRSAMSMQFRLTPGAADGPGTPALQAGVAHRWADAGDGTRLARIVGPRDLALRETDEAHHRAAGGGVFLLLGRPCVVVLAAAARSGEQRKPDAAGA